MMKTDDLVSRLDDAFGIATSKEDLQQYAVVDDNRHLLNPDFLEGKTGLVLKSSNTVHRVFTAVFISAGVVEKILEHPNSLIFTHHHFDCFEDERGLKLNLIGGTHYGTERPAMIRVVEMFRQYEVPCDYCEDEGLLNAL
jgi:putative NIF3 family GTP cyclohydrolase 1 type 2